MAMVLNATLESAILAVDSAQVAQDLKTVIIGNNAKHQDLFLDLAKELRARTTLSVKLLYAVPQHAQRVQLTMNA